MTFEDVAKELELLFPDCFQELEEAEFKELRSMDFPDELKKFYRKHDPVESLDVGRFRLLPLKDLIDLNVWDEYGESFYRLGLSIVGESADGSLYCLDMAGENALGGNDVLLASREIDMAAADLKKARSKLKFQASSLGELLAKEIAFCRKKKAVRG
ncbi:MAG TPA: hypothetical protein PLU72_10200 [Candidatus Ozemobacteraceae bacterium]|nr:hypothetical protein [Candidatus Ozemobacteraceae bacterium]HQG29463.1 hypothetical protein [Candidatus Ozemobacteraceae bacterium]